MDSEYKIILVETFKNSGELSNAEVRVRPYPGQGLNAGLRVECSRKMREKYPIGTILRLKVRVTTRQEGTPFLYAHYSWNYEVLSEEEAEAHIESTPPFQDF